MYRELKRLNTRNELNYLCNFCILKCECKCPDYCIVNYQCKRCMHYMILEVDPETKPKKLFN